MKYVSALLALGCALTVNAQQWQAELVDASCTPTNVFVKHDSVRTYIAYVTGDGSIRIASKDTIWHYETLDTGLVSPYLGLHFAHGPAGRMAVSGVDDSFRPVVVEKLDSVWSRIWTREDRGMAMAVYGVDSVPTIVYGVNPSMVHAYVIVETCVDSLWQVDTAARFEPDYQFVTLSLYDADGSQEAGPCFLIVYTHGLPKCGQSPTSIEVYKGFRSGEGWSLVGLGAGYDISVDAYDVTAGGADTASAATYVAGYTKFDHETVLAGRVIDAAVQVDTAGRQLMAFVASDGSLRFAYKDAYWHYREVPGVIAATCCDLALDEYGQPMIAFEDAGGLWLARGIDMLGTEESHKPQAPSRKQEATVLSGASGVGRLASSVIFDAMGRRVVNPRSGILFVRDEGRGAGDAGWTRKVVLQR
jgi:hypothetical protein